MGIYLDEPLAVMAAAALSLAGAAAGAWWQRRRSAPPTSDRAAPAGSIATRLDARLERLEQLAEATALEVERVAEGQRFTTRLLAERAAERAPLGAQPVVPPARAAEHRTLH